MSVRARRLAASRQIDDQIDATDSLDRGRLVLKSITLRSVDVVSRMVVGY